MLSHQPFEQPHAPHELLTPVAEFRLAELIKRGSVEARETMIRSNLGLVHALARPYGGRGVPLADLIQDGTVGLIRAVDGFDHRRGVRFSTYASWWIRHAIFDALAASNVISIPPTANRHLVAVQRAVFELESTGRLPTDAAVAEQAHLSVRTVCALRGAARVTTSIDEPFGEAGTVLSEVVADEGLVDPSECALHSETCQELWAGLWLLPERHREVLVRRFGLNSALEQSHEEIAKWLGLSEARSRQIERDALVRLRSMPLAA